VPDNADGRGRLRIPAGECRRFSVLLEREGIVMNKKNLLRL
jgi:hypothetical protein